jgi:hypothetical protein
MTELTPAEVLAEMFANSRDPEKAAQLVIDQLAEAGLAIVRMAGHGFRMTVAEFAAAHKAEKKETIVKMAGDIFEEMIAEDLAAGRVERVPGKEDTYRNVMQPATAPDDAEETGLVVEDLGDGFRVVKGTVRDPETGEIEQVHQISTGRVLVIDNPEVTE